MVFWRGPAMSSWHSGVVPRGSAFRSRAVTTGSDAHRADSFAFGLAEGYGVLAGAGYVELAFRRGAEGLRVPISRRDDRVRRSPGRLFRVRVGGGVWCSGGGRLCRAGIPAWCRGAPRSDPAPLPHLTAGTLGRYVPRRRRARTSRAAGEEW